MNICINSEDKLRGIIPFTGSFPEDAFKLRLWKLDSWQRFRYMVPVTNMIPGEPCVHSQVLKSRVLLQDDIWWLHILRERGWTQFSSVALSCLTLCDPLNCSTPGLPVHHQIPEFTQTHTHWIGDAVQPSHPLFSPSPPALNVSQHQGLFQWVSSLHQVAKALEFQLQHQSFQWTPRTDLL